MAYDPYNRQGARRAQDAQITQAGRYGTAGSDAYLKYAQGFNAGDALNRYAKGAWGSISTALGKELEGLRGQSVGAGRFDSGLLDADTGDVYQRALNDFSNNLAQQSMNAVSADQRNAEGLASFGEHYNDQATDLVASRREEEENRYREEQARKRRRRSGIGGAIGGVLGAAVGSAFPGVGTAIGYKLGSGLGGAIGG